MTQAYYRKTPQQALEAQNASAEGLSAQEARRRAEQYGPNKLSEGKKKSTLQVFLEQFKDLMVLILIIAAVISAFSGNVESTIVIFAVLVLNAILGTVQYEKAEKSLESLKAMASPHGKGDAGRCAGGDPLRRRGARRHRPAGGRGHGGGRWPGAGELLPQGQRVLPHRRERGRGQDGRGHRCRPGGPWATRRTWCSPAPW